MKQIKILVSILVVIMTLSSCNSNTSKNASKELTLYQCPMKCEGEKTYTETGSCPVCKMDLQPIVTEEKNDINGEEISETSIFNLASKWHTEEGEEIQLKDLKGKTLVMVMIYTTCKAACPRLVADMRNIEKQVPNNDKLRYVLVSIDPETDTPERLKAFAIENEMDADYWTFLQGTESSVQEFANVLAVKYKKISPIDFSHSNIISVFNDKGELMHQQQGLGVDNKETVATILQLTQM